jgi:hypothetical protein
MKLLSLLFGCVCGFSLAQQAQPMVPPSYDISLPGHPFGIVTSQDDQWVFVALADDISGGSIAVLQRGDQGYGLVRTIPLPSGPTGIVMTHDGQLLGHLPGRRTDDARRLGRCPRVVQRWFERRQCCCQRDR